VKSLKVSENANRRDDLGHTPIRSSLVIILIILISATLVGYGINEKVQALAQHSIYSNDHVIQYGNYGIRSFNDLFGNFSGMSLVENFTSPDGTTSSFVISYSVLGVTVINDIRTYEVNISGTAVSTGQSNEESVLAWISASSGKIVQTYDSDYGYLQGARAEAENSTLYSFTTIPFLSMLNSSTVEQVQGSEQSMTIGQITMDVTTYHGLQNYSTLQNWIASVGIIPETQIQLVVFCSYVSSSGNQFAFRILSVENSHVGS
jgi:hypothetical protein